MDPKTEEALDASIAHWEDVCSTPIIGDVNLGTKACGLCNKFVLAFKEAPMLSFPVTLKNNPARKGELAARKQFFGENRRYAVAPVHTRFDMLEWFVWDAEHPLSDLNHAEVIRQAETLEEALRGL